MAGSDTTGIIMRAVIYHVLKNPEIYRKLRIALEKAKLTLPISYDRAKDISYLEAVISEAVRFHPAVGLPLERVVPAQGLRLLDGRYLPSGTIVGMNAWVVNRDRAVYGVDADQFVPERWLRRDDETSTEWEARKRKMQEFNLTFGAGNRVCTGKTVSLMEMYKLIATLFCLYEVSDGFTSSSSNHFLFLYLSPSLLIFNHRFSVN
jgi:cytochrome P450